MVATTTIETVSSADGTTIAFERSGEGPPLVLVHGMASNRQRWELFDVRSRLTEHATVYAMDRRGHGESVDGPEREAPVSQPEADASGDATAYALAREFEDVAAVVDAIDEPVHLLGHSHGGLCAMEAALLTDNLRSLVLYEPAGPWEAGHLYSPELDDELTALVEARAHERALERFLRQVVGLSDAQLKQLRGAPTWAARVDEAPTLPREYRAPIDHAFEPERFAALTVPTLMLDGGESPQWARDATRQIHEAIPNSRIEVLEGQGHLAMNTAPERFVDAVLAFVRETT